jgi:hypothetical protein
MNSSRWKVWVAAIVIFFAGIAVGSVITVGIGSRMLRNAIRANPTAAGQADRSMVRLHRNIVRELKLDDANSAKIKSELDQTALELKRLRFATVLRARAILREAVNRIATDLPPEKREKFKTMSEQRLRRVGLDPEQTPDK